MRAGYKIKSCINKNNNFIYVWNYHYINEVQMLSTENRSKFEPLTEVKAIGVWKRKIF